MPPARSLPRKYLSIIQDSVGDLKGLGQRIGRVIEELERERKAPPTLLTALRSLQAQCYAAALRLSEVEVAGCCDECPAAPGQTSAQVLCAVLNRELLRLADVAHWGTQRKRWASVSNPHHEEG